MDEKQLNKRAQLFNLTITELLLLLIFLLLIFAGILLKKYNDMKVENDKLYDEKHERSISKIYDCPDMDCEYVIVPEPDWNKKLSDAETAEEKLAEETDQKQKARKEADEAKEEAEKAIADAENAKGEADEAIAEAENAKEEADEAKEEAEKAIADAENAKGELDKIRKEIAIGVGPPPCWIEPGTVKSTDFLFDLIMHSDGIQFRNSFPPNRAGDFKSLPININYSKHYTIEEFRILTSEINSFGRNQIDKHPEGCRFYITMYDNLKDNEKKLLKDYQQEIQKVFYQRNEIRNY
jgi:flagellar biosynthesis GTPase FlhF